MNFVLDLKTVYDVTTKKRLRPDVLQPLIDVFSKIYANIGRQLSAKEYEAYLETCLRSLLGFSDKIHPYTLEAPPATTLFKTQHQLSEFVTDASEGKQTLAGGQFDAYQALTQPFKDLQAQLTLFDLSKCRVGWYLEHVPLPDWNDKGAEREYREQGKQRDKDFQEALDDASLMEKATNATPLYLYANLLEPNQTIEVPFDIPEERWFEGTWIVAAQGRGKTNLLRHLALSLPEDSCFIFMDAKGELIESFTHLKAYQDRLVLLEPNAQYPLAINPLDIGGHSVELLEYIFSALLETKMTPNQSTLFRLTLLLCTKIPNATLETFREIMQHGWKKYEKEMRTLKKRDQDFFEFEWDSKLYKERRPEVLSRLRTLMASPSLDEILSAPTTKLDMGQLMDAGRIICINNNYDLLGEQGAEFFGRLFIALVWAAARRRTKLPEHQKRPIYFFIDEAHFAIARDPNIATLIDQCRAQKIAMIFAHQRIDQIKDEDVKSALTNCAIKFANSTGDAPELAVRLGGGTKPEFIRAQKRGQFACHVLDATETAVSVSVPFVDMTQYPKMTEAEFLDVQARSRTQFCQGFTYNSADEDLYRTAQRHQRPGDHTHQSSTTPPPYGDTLQWNITISPKKALKGGAHPLQILADPSGQKKSINITIPAGTVDGARFRLKGAGIFRRDGTRGDIVLTVRVPTTAQHSQVSLYGSTDDPDEIG